MATKTHSRLPSDFPYTPGQVLPGGAQLHVLPTLEQLITFWNRKQQVLPYAVCSTSEDSNRENWFLEAYEWIFAPTPAAVTRAVLRWDRYEIRPTWYDWAGQYPEEHAAFFQHREQRRNQQMAAGIWTREQEFEFQSDSRTPETYRGWWELANLPAIYTTEVLFGWGPPEEIIDRNLSVKQVEEQLQLRTFESYQGYCSSEEIMTFDRAGLDKYIRDELEARERGGGYYGRQISATQAT